MADHDYRVGAILEEQARAAIPDRGWLKGYVNWASQACDANLAYHLVSGLAVLTQSVPIEYSIPFGGLSVFTPIFGLLVGSLRLVEALLYREDEQETGSRGAGAEFSGHTQPSLPKGFQCSMF